MPNNSPTEAGHSKASADNKLALVDAINQVFTLFRLNYHNQYLKAFGNTEELSEVKRLWLEMLQRFSADTVLRGAKTVIENSEYLPTLHTMIHACERAAQRDPLPDAHAAYVEACQAPSPKAAHAWSHPLVYHAGRATGWHFLQSSSEAEAYPVFKKQFEALVVDLRAGQDFARPTAPALPEADCALGKPESLQKLKEFRQKLKL